MEYASHITVYDDDDGFNARIANPWKKNTLLHTYTFSTSGETQYSYNKASNTIHIPLRRIVVMTNSLAHLPERVLHGMWREARAPLAG